MMVCIRVKTSELLIPFAAKSFGIRGGTEMWKLRKMDFELKVHSESGRSYIQYNEATSKNYKGGLKDQGKLSRPPTVRFGLLPCAFLSCCKRQ
jgi:hypothetical protein